MLTPRLVLTCAHMSDEARLRIARTDGTEIACRTVWKRPGALDAALVLTDENILDSEDWERLLPSRLNWGRMPEGLTSPVRVTSYERSGKRTELSGQARPTAVMLTLEGTEPFTKDVLTGSSGALVSYDGFFVGMVTRRHLQRPQLMAVPAALLLQDQGFRRTLAAHMTTPYELEDMRNEPTADPWEGPSAVCLAVEVRIVGGRRDTDAPRLEPELTHDIRDSMTAIMRRAGIDGVVAEEAVADARADLLMRLDGPTAVQDMGRVLAELPTAAATHHDVTVGVAASIGEVTGTRLGLVGGAVSEAVRLAANSFFREQLHQAARFVDSPVHFAVSNTLRARIGGMLGPAWERRFVPLEPHSQRDPEVGWMYEGSTEQLGGALAAWPQTSPDANASSTRAADLAEASGSTASNSPVEAERPALAVPEEDAELIRDTYGFAVSEGLYRWARERGRKLHRLRSLLGTERIGYTGSAVFAVEVAPPARQLVLQVLPPEAAERDYAASDALSAVPAFSQLHLVHQPFEPLRLADNRILRFYETPGWNLSDVTTLGSLSGEEFVQVLEEVVRGLLTVWNGLGQYTVPRSLTVSEFLRRELDDVWTPGGSLQAWGHSLHWLDAAPSWLYSDGIPVPNPYAMIQGGNAVLPDPVVRVLRGHGHGDLHLDNIVVPRQEGVIQAHAYRVIDMSTFSRDADLGRDIVTLLLSALVPHVKHKLSPEQRHALLRFIVAPDATHRASITPGATASVEAVRSTADEAMRHSNLGGAWDLQFLLSLTAGALRYTTYTQIGDEGRRWFARLAAHAGGELLARTGERDVGAPRPAPKPGRDFFTDRL